MTTPATPLTPTDIIVASSSLLQSGGYQPIEKGFKDWNTSTTRLFENEYNVVGLAVFTTCAELLRSWANLQGSLVDLISQSIGSGENKAWDGYLVLLTTGVAPSGDLDIESIRHDTTRLRKLIATGDDLVGAGDVERLLRPLLPLRPDTSSVSQRSALEMLPDLLEERGIDRDTTRLLVQAFNDQKPLMEVLYHGGSKP